jgi:serine protease Do
MKARTTAAVTAAMVTGLGIGAAMGPEGARQVRAQWEPSQIVQVFSGGSYIGVSVRDVDAEDAQRAKLPSTAGVLVEDVRDDSPAQKAGFKEGDIVVEFDGERVRSTRQFTRLVQETPPQREVQAIVMRDGQRTTLSVQPAAPEGFRLGDRNWESLIVPRTPRAPRAVRPPEPPNPPEPPDMLPRFEHFFSSSGRLGITVDSLSDQLADYFGTKEGVLVTSVTSDSAAAKAGVKAGDVVVAINGTPVNSPSDLSRRTQRLEDGEEFTLDVVRNKQKQTLKGKVEARQARRWTTHTI